MRILYFYKWCTLGGVERVIANRAMAFKKYNMNIKMDIYFFYKGENESFKKFICDYQLEDYLGVVDEVNLNLYDLFVTIDTEEAFKIKGVDNFILEFHTMYKEHAKYLKDIDKERVRKIIVPSSMSKDVLKGIRPDLADNSFILRNFVIEYQKENEAANNGIHLPEWNMIPIVWLGRIDELKNTYFTIKGLKAYKKAFGDGIFFCCVGHSLEEKKFVKFIKKENMESRVVWFPDIGFGETMVFLREIKKRKAVFVSSSKAESFGMSVAEALFCGLPVLVSNIPSHSFLVSHYDDFLFGLGNTDDFISKLNNIVNNYNYYSRKAFEMGRKLSEKSFLDGWERFCEEMGL